MRALGLSGLGPAFLPLDERDRPLRPAILYGVDTRATTEIEELSERYGAAAVLDRCGAAITSQSVGPKALWVRRHEPGVWARTQRIAMIASYLVRRLTGEYVLDRVSGGIWTPLYDIAMGSWIEDRWAEVAPGPELPNLHWASEPSGRISAAAAIACGLPEGIPVARVDRLSRGAESVEGWQALPE